MVLCLIASAVKTEKTVVGRPASGCSSENLHADGMCMLVAECAPHLLEVHSKVCQASLRCHWLSLYLQSKISEGEDFPVKLAQSLTALALFY